MNEYGAMVVEVDSTHATRHIVEYSSSDLKSTLRQLPSGSSLPLKLEPVGTRANVWRAIDISENDASVNRPTRSYVE